MKLRIGIPPIPLIEQTPTVRLLLNFLEQQQLIIHQQAEEIAILKEEVKRLKKHKGKPRIPSQMNNGKSNNESSTNPKKKRAGSAKRDKNTKLQIHEDKIISAENIPEGSRFKGYQNYFVQDLIIQPRNTRYRLERWKLPNGRYYTASIPSDVIGYHFGSTLRSFIDYQYHHQRVTQPLLWEQLKDYGVDISSGELNHLLTENKDIFHQEKLDILPAGLAASSYIHVDDTGARHQGKNGYCTHIGNELFAWFESTGSKSRINFLELLQMNQREREYAINADGLDYMKRHKLPSSPLNSLKQADIVLFTTRESWKLHLDLLGIKAERHRQVATEGALVGGLLSKGFFVDLTIMSDDAGQFNIFQHILCWIHAERKINELIPLHDAHAKDIDHIRGLFWAIYNSLKEYKSAPTNDFKMKIEKDFDVMCATETCYQLLNNALKRLNQNKKELLLVLEHPHLPLHNNLSERDIREYVTKRKVSGGTRSDIGRKCRDTFASLKKTCRKLKINFWDYLLDRHSKKFTIPRIPNLISLAASLVPA